MSSRRKRLGSVSVMSSRRKRAAGKLQKSESGIVTKRIVQKPKPKSDPTIKQENVTGSEKTKEMSKDEVKEANKESLVENIPKVKKKKIIAVPGDVNVKGKKKLKRKLTAVEETNSDKEKNKIRKSELDLLDGTIVSRRHGRTCTKDQEESTINKPEKKFKKPVIKGVKEKKPNVLSKEALSQLPGTTKERRSSTSSTISNSSELSITSALNKLESLKTGGKLSSSSKMSEPESLKSKASTSSKTSTSSKSSTKTKKNAKELNKNEEKVDNSTAQKKIEPDKAKKKLKKPFLKARTRLTPSTRSINSSGISASVTKKKLKKPFLKARTRLS